MTACETELINADLLAFFRGEELQKAAEAPTLIEEPKPAE